MSKKKNKDVKKNEEHLKSWDKVEYLQKKLDSRPKEFFIKASFLYTRISFFLVFVCFSCIGLQFYKIHQIKIEKGYYISGIDGRIYNIKMNEEKYNKMMGALQAYRENKIQENKVKK